MKIRFITGATSQFGDFELASDMELEIQTGSLAEAEAQATQLPRAFIEFLRETADGLEEMLDADEKGEADGS